MASYRTATFPSGVGRPAALLIALAVATVAVLDVVSTNAGLAAGAVEANPLMATAQESLGAWWAAPKVALQLLTATIVLARPSRAVFICVGAVTSVNAAVVINNLALAGIF